MELLEKTAEGSGRRFQAPDREVVVIGRDPSCDICITKNPDVNISGVSHKHAELIFDGDDWYIRDLNSRNGVYVLGEEGYVKVTLDKLPDFADFRLGRNYKMSISYKNMGFGVGNDTTVTSS